MPIEAVIFDLDGVLLDSEHVWDAVREQLTIESGGRWHDQAQREMMGMSSIEWSRYMHDTLAVPLDSEEISAEVASRVISAYGDELPLFPDAAATVEALARRWPLAVASSSNRPVIDLVLRHSGLDRFFAATVSSEEVERGKPAPDVYLEAAAKLGKNPARCAAIEDSSNGLRAARDAGMRVVALPNRSYPPAPEALELADVVLDSLDRLRAEVIDPAAPSRRRD